MSANGVCRFALAVPLDVGLTKAQSEALSWSELPLRWAELPETAAGSADPCQKSPAVIRCPSTVTSSKAILSSEYPQTMKQVSQADMTPVKKTAYQRRLKEGFALHERGRSAKNGDLMKKAVKLLDDIKIEIDN